MSKLLTARQAAEYAEQHFGIGNNQFKSMCRNGLGPAFVKPGKRWNYYRPEDLDQWQKSWIEQPLGDTMKQRLRDQIHEVVENIHKENK